MNYSDTEQRPPTERGRAILAFVEVGRLVETKLEQALAEQGLSLSKLNVLTLLAGAQESLVLSELAAKLQCGRSNVTQVMDRLEGEGLVRRLFDATDRRTIRAELTQLGREKQVMGSRILSGMSSGIASDLSEGEMQLLGRLTAKLK